MRSSPLAALSPGGRKRFLAGLDFGPRGLQSISFDDPAHELMHAQIVALFTLFDAQDYAGNLGLSTGAYTAYRTERATAAAARHCTVQTCAESALEQAFDRLVQPSREHRSSAAYDLAFAPWQTRQALQSLDKPDLRLAQRAAFIAATREPSAAHARQAELAVEEMTRRDMSTIGDYRKLLAIFVAARQFDQAERVARDHLPEDARTLPHFVASAALPGGSPTALQVDVASGTMRRKAVELRGPLHIVVIAGCHFSESAARAIHADSELRDVFARHATWLAAPAQPLADVADWNREFPDMPMQVAWTTEDWAMLDDWAMPTYYVFWDGHETARFKGWNGVETLKRELRRAKVLP